MYYQEENSSTVDLEVLLKEERMNKKRNKKQFGQIEKKGRVSQ